MAPTLPKPLLARNHCPKLLLICLAEFKGLDPVLKKLQSLFRKNIDHKLVFLSLLERMVLSCLAQENIHLGLREKKSATSAKFNIWLLRNTNSSAVARELIHSIPLHIGDCTDTSRKYYPGHIFNCIKSSTHQLPNPALSSFVTDFSIPFLIFYFRRNCLSPSSVSAGMFFSLSQKSSWYRLPNTSSIF